MNSILLTRKQKLNNFLLHLIFFTKIEKKKLLKLFHLTYFKTLKTSSVCFNRIIISTLYAEHKVTFLLKTFRIMCVMNYKIQFSLIFRSRNSLHGMYDSSGPSR